jgi:hypothetical protein
MLLYAKISQIAAQCTHLKWISKNECTEEEGKFLGSGEILWRSIFLKDKKI